MSEILVGVDGTAGAEDALAFAEQLAGATGATLRPATVTPEDGVSPPHALHRLADEHDAALVVVGSTHRGPIGRVLPGSTAERLLHGATCPVAIVPRGYRARPQGEIRTIGVGYDASDESRAALAAACELARRFRAALRVIRIFDSTEVGTPGLAVGPAYAEVYKDVEERQRADLDRCVAGLPQDIGAEGVFLGGAPHHELAEQSHSLDLLLVGSRGYGPLRAVLLGGVSHGLVRSAACPVMS